MASSILEGGGPVQWGLKEAGEGKTQLPNTNAQWGYDFGCKKQTRKGKKQVGEQPNHSSTTTSWTGEGAENDFNPLLEKSVIGGEEG